MSDCLIACRTVSLSFTTSGSFSPTDSKRGVPLQNRPSITTFSSCGTFLVQVMPLSNNMITTRPKLSKSVLYWTPVFSIVRSNMNRAFFLGLSKNTHICCSSILSYIYIYIYIYILTFLFNFGFPLFDIHYHIQGSSIEKNNGKSKLNQG